MGPTYGGRGGIVTPGTGGMTCIRAARSKSICPPAGMDNATIAPVSGTAQYCMTQSRVRRRYRVVSTTRPSIDDVSTLAPRARITSPVVPAGAVTRSTTRLVPSSAVSLTNDAFGAASGTRATLLPVNWLELSDRYAVHSGLGPGVRAPIASRVQESLELANVPNQASLESAFSAYTSAEPRGWSALGCTVRAAIARITAAAPAPHCAPDQRAFPAMGSSSGASRREMSHPATASAVARVPAVPRIPPEPPETQ